MSIPTPAHTWAAFSLYRLRRWFLTAGVNNRGSWWGSLSTLVNSIMENNFAIFSLGGDIKQIQFPGNNVSSESIIWVNFFSWTEKSHSLMFCVAQNFFISHLNISYSFNSLNFLGFHSVLTEYQEGD